MTDVEWLQDLGNWVEDEGAYRRIASRYEAMEKELERLMDVVHETDCDSIMLALGRKP